MLQKLVTTAGAIYRFVMSLVITVLLGAATWFCWEFYEEVRLQSQFAEEGKLVPVRVDAVDHRQRSWRDALGNAAYLTVTYGGKPYVTRFVIDTTYVSAGDQVRLLYHPAYDAFRQPDRGPAGRPSTTKSRLIQWSTLETAGPETKWLLLCVLLTTAFFFCGSGVLVSLIPVPFLQDIARLVFTIELFAVTIFLTYDTYTYFQYYQQLKSQGRPVTVTVLDTDRRLFGRDPDDGWYDYEANVRFDGREYRIPISRAGYDTRKAGDSLDALYDPSVPDLMAADFPPDYMHLILPFFFGLLTIMLMRSVFDHRQPQPATDLR